MRSSEFVSLKVVAMTFGSCLLSFAAAWHPSIYNNYDTSDNLIESPFPFRTSDFSSSESYYHNMISSHDPPVVGSIPSSLRPVFVLLRGTRQMLQHANTNNKQNFYWTAEKMNIPLPEGEADKGCLATRTDKRLYSNLDGRCYTVGSRVDGGPCGPRMIFLPIPNNKTHGHCLCDHENYDRPLVQYQNKCQLLYTQAHCGRGKWLGVDGEGNVNCETSPCKFIGRKESAVEADTAFVPFHGKCVRLNSESTFCKRNQVVGFVRGQLRPTCGPIGPYVIGHRRVNRQVTSVGSLKCRSGQRYSKLTKKCARRFTFFRLV